MPIPPYQTPVCLEGKEKLSHSRYEKWIAGAGDRRKGQQQKNRSPEMLHDHATMSEGANLESICGSLGVTGKA